MSIKLLVYFYTMIPLPINCISMGLITYLMFEIQINYMWLFKKIEWMKSYMLLLFILYVTLVFLKIIYIVVCFSSKTSNFVTDITFHEVGTRFCWPNQTHQHVYQEKIHFGSNRLRHQMGGKQRHYTLIQWSWLQNLYMNSISWGLVVHLF